MEDGSSFVLYTGEIRRLQISEGVDLSEDVLKEIYQEILSKRAKKRCMFLLKSMDRTIAQLRDTLKRDGYPDEITDEAMEYLASYHYIDDRRYAENYIRLQAGKKSMMQIRADLMRKGISRDLAAMLLDEYSDSLKEGSGDFCGSEAFDDSDSEEQGPDLDAIRYLMKKRRFDPDTADEAESRRFIAYLMRRGFSLSDIRRALS